MRVHVWMNPCACSWLPTVLAPCTRTYVRFCEEADGCRGACVFRAASRSRRGAVSLADLCRLHSAQTETPTHVKCHSTNLFPMQPRYNCRGTRQTHLTAPQKAFTNVQIYWLYFNEIWGILGLMSVLYLLLLGTSEQHTYVFYFTVSMVIPYIITLFELAVYF